jgi:post-segregation antitoxin (ccd killing protein)
MTTVELTLDLPDQLARDARDAGLLAPAAIKDLLEAGVRKKAVERMQQAAARGSAAGEPEMSLADLQALVKSVRKSAN